MPKIDLYAAKRNRYKINPKDEKTPYKIIASGIIEPQRFATEKLALDYFDKHQGRALLSYNSRHLVKILKYKFN